MLMTINERGRKREEERERERERGLSKRRKNWMPITEHEVFGKKSKT